MKKWSLWLQQIVLTYSTPRFFAPVSPGGEKNDDPYLDKIRDVLTPVLSRLLSGRRLRRVTSMVPKSRSRTFRALLACGFKKEGQMRRAVKFAGRDAEDVVIMGLLPEKE